MVRTLLMAAAAAAALTGCSQDMTRSQRAVEEQILSDRMQDWSRVLNNRDADSLTSFYHQDASVRSTWFDGRRARGWQETEPAIREFLRGIATMNVVVQDPSVEVLGFDAAVTSFRYSADLILTSTEREIFSGVGTLVWTRDPETETWVIHAEHVSRNP